MKHLKNLLTHIVLSEVNQNNKAQCWQFFGEIAILTYITIILFFTTILLYIGTFFFFLEKNLATGNKIFKKCLFPLAWLFHFGEVFHSMKSLTIYLSCVRHCSGFCEHSGEVSITPALRVYNPTGRKRHIHGCSGHMWFGAQNPCSLFLTTRV